MTEPMYEKLLGEAFANLPEPVRAMHSGVRRAAGEATIVWGASLLARAICEIARMPQAGERVPAETRFEPIDNGERWVRAFNGQSFKTDLTIAHAGPEPELTERFGPLKFRLRIIAHEHGVDLIPEGVSILGLPLPRFICPEAIGLERVRDGIYHFDVTVRFPLAGDVITYSGWLISVAEE